MPGQFGDVVGMTGYPEVVLARGDFLMLRIPLHDIINGAYGMKERSLSLAELVDQMKVSSDVLKEVIARTLKAA